LRGILSCLPVTAPGYFAAKKFAADAIEVVSRED
jgi:hypothetical protein